MTPLELLKRARERIAKQDSVPKGRWAFDGNWCAIGAIIHEAGHAIVPGAVAAFNDPMVRAARDALHTQAQIVTNHQCESAYQVNDLLGRDAVLEVYDAAIDELEKAQP